jgi:hypothetical protein
LAHPVRAKSAKTVETAINVRIHLLPICRRFLSRHEPREYAKSAGLFSSPMKPPPANLASEGFFGNCSPRDVTMPTTACPPAWTVTCSTPTFGLALAAMAVQGFEQRCVGVR